MKKNKVKTMTLIILLIPIIVFMIGTNKVRADSGFDSSWDSGSSSSSGSSWGGGYRDSSDYSSSSKKYNSRYHSGNNSVIGLLFVILFFSALPIAFFIVAPVIYIKDRRRLKVMYLSHDKEMLNNEVRKILFDFNKKEFLQERFRDFVDIQNGWMNFDYNLLKEKLSDEIYNQYVMQLDTLKEKNQKNVMSDFEYIDSMITNITEINDKIIVTLELLTKFYDYLEQDGKVIRGNKHKKITMHYEITFVCSKEKTDICPNCNAKVLNGNVCNYCHTVISQVGKHFVMMKKEAKRQG